MSTLVMAFEPYVGVTLVRSRVGVVHVLVGHDPSAGYRTRCRRRLQYGDVWHTLGTGEATCHDCQVRHEGGRS